MITILTDFPECSISDDVLINSSFILCLNQFRSVFVPMHFGVQYFAVFGTVSGKKNLLVEKCSVYSSAV